MTRRTRILLVILGVVTLAAAVWIAMNLWIREVSYTDEIVDIELVEPQAPAPTTAPSPD